MVRTGAVFCGISSFSLVLLLLWCKWKAEETRTCNCFPLNEEICASEISIYRGDSENKTWNKVNQKSRYLAASTYSFSSNAYLSLSGLYLLVLPKPRSHLQWLKTQNSLPRWLSVKVLSEILLFLFFHPYFMLQTCCKGIRLSNICIWRRKEALTFDLTARMILGRATIRHFNAMVRYFSTKSAIPTIHIRSKKSSFSRLGFRKMRLKGMTTRLKYQ